ncbi:hypothetical protein CKAH01_16388 [Colletotrichum kahawae]|uniref:Uncharacterized protein n=1 Tax=Colletotrichum kahawae TaxID=34407 RepID=A0AAD9YG77_COLKA|nr:hypothetical protein CKAH01_16388 [Colletotrichum kahawae]
MARSATPAAKKFLDSIASPFIDDTPAHARIPRIMSTMAYENDMINSPVPRLRTFDADQTGRPFSSSDADMLLRLSCFFAPLHDIPVEMLRLGTTPRNRWTKNGSTATRQSRVHPNLAAFISNQRRTDAALQALVESGAISFDTVNGHKTYKIRPRLMEETLAKLELDCIKFWKQQALLVLYHAITWKYIEPSTPVATMTVPHLQHVLKLDGDLSADIPGFNLAPEIEEDLVLTLTEAARLPKISWKAFAVDQARAFCRVGQSAYAVSRVLENLCLVRRLSKKEIPWLKDEHAVGTADPNDLRTHAANGLTALQDCLDEMQREAFSKAEEVLDGWEPISKQPMVQVVLFRKYCLLGQIKRQQGLFPQAVQAVETALKIANEHRKNGLYFDEDLPSLACSYADTLREQRSFNEAEKHLQWNLQNPVLSFRSRSQIQASLVECLFAKGHKMLIDGEHCEARQILENAEKLCQKLVHLESEPILRFDQLRTWLTFGKISFIRGDYVGAEHRFQEAMNVINKFERTNGYATTVIITSMIHTLRRSLEAVDHDPEAQINRQKALEQSCKELEILKSMADPNGTRFWIPGLCEWEEWLRTQDLRRQSHL